MSNAPAAVLWMDSWGQLAGGGQRSLLEAVTRLDSRRFRPVVVCGSEGDLVSQLRQRGIGCSVIPFPGLLEAKPARRESSAQLDRLIEKEHIRLIHANALRPALYAAPVARRRRIPLVFHARVLRSHAHEWLVDQYLRLNCAAIIANSQTVADRFRFCPGAAQVSVIPNGIDLAAFDRGDGASFRRRMGLPETRVLVGIVGMLDPRKGHCVLFDAMARLATDFPSAQLVVAGDEPPGIRGHAAQLRELAQAPALKGRVHFLGQVDDIPGLMAALDICVLPVIRPEGFGRVVVEAGAARRPVIASRIGALPQTLRHGHTGLLVQPGNVTALAEALRSLLSNAELRKQLGEAGHDWVASRFSLENTVERISVLYDCLLAERLK